MFLRGWLRLWWLLQHHPRDKLWTDIFQWPWLFHQICELRAAPTEWSSTDVRWTSSHQRCCLCHTAVELLTRGLKRAGNSSKISCSPLESCADRIMWCSVSSHVLVLVSCICCMFCVQIVSCEWQNKRPSDSHKTFLLLCFLSNCCDTHFTPASF